MLADILILFFVALGAGGLAFYLPKVINGNYKLALVFAGSYLFFRFVLRRSDSYSFYTACCFLFVFTAHYGEGFEGCKYSICAIHRRFCYPFIIGFTHSGI